MKNKAKGEEPYSVLNPETSSDSPSLKSKGARLVSARADTNQSNVKKGKNTKKGTKKG